MLFKKYPDSLTNSAIIRLVSAVLFIIIFGSGTIFAVIAYYEKRRLMEEAIEFIAASSNLITKSVSYQMLHRSPESIQNTVQNLADGANIETIRIFDGKGRVAYSSVPKESYAGPGPTTKTCSGCHDDHGVATGTLSEKRDWRIQDKGKSRNLVFSEPIYNEPSCSAAECHFHPRTQRVLGWVETVFSFSRTYKQMNKAILNKTLFPVVSFCLTFSVAVFLFWRLHYRRFSIFLRDPAKSAAGESGPVVSSKYAEPDVPSDAFSGIVCKSLPTASPRDIPEGKGNKRSVRAEDFVGMALDSIRDPFIILDREYRIVKANEAYAEMREIPLKDLRNAKCHEVIYDNDARCKDCLVEKTFRSGDPCAKDKIINLHDSGEIWVEIYTYPIRDEHANISHVIEHLRDVTDRKRTEQRMKLAYLEMERIFDMAADAMCVIDENFKILRVNNMFLNLIGRTKEDAVRRSCCDVFPDPECGTPNCYLTKMLRDSDRVIHFESERSLGDGKEAHFIITATAFRGDDGKLIGIVEDFKDISEMKKKEYELRCLSLHDDLTGLNNRRGFLALADQELKRADRLQQHLVLFYFDLDGLKNINDTLGHEEGDRALKAVASALKATFRTSDIIGRIGGDEFVVMTTARISDGAVVAERLQASIAICNKRNDKYKISLSTGLVHYDPACPCPVNELLIQADTLMYEEKRRKRS